MHFTRESSDLAAFCALVLFIGALLNLAPILRALP